MVEERLFDPLGDKMDTELLALQIRDYWYARGYRVTTSIEFSPRGSGHYSLRSDMVNGRPASWPIPDTRT